jgi:hypothetical protein
LNSPHPYIGFASSQSEAVSRISDQHDWLHPYIGFASSQSEAVSKTHDEDKVQVRKINLRTCTLQPTENKIRESI